MSVSLVVERPGPELARRSVIEAGRAAAARGWVPATSGNFSVRADGERIAVTRSGVDKGRLTEADVLLQPLHGALLPGSSAEAELHLRIYRLLPQAGAVFHTHGLWASVIGRRSSHSVRLQGWELQKALAGVRSHETTVRVPVLPNSQDVAALAEELAQRLAQPPADAVAAPGALIAGHGLYAWGADPAEAWRHLEALESLFELTLTLERHAP